jgi:hypothetical protein
MHYGFAQPYLGMLLLPPAAVILAPSWWIKAAVAAGSVLFFVGGEVLARRRALGRVRRWAAARGIRDVGRCPRGGFVTWSWSVWAFADTGPYRGVAADGSPVELEASYYAPAFGLAVFTQCEIKAEPVAPPARAGEK